MSYLTTKKQFLALNSMEHHDIAQAILRAPASYTHIRIELRQPPAGIAASRIYATLVITDYSMAEYIRINSKIPQQSISINKLTNWMK
jgi:hypothetical protein